MKVSSKKKICIANAILSVAAFLLIHATVWLSRGETLQWIYFDDYFLFIIPTIVSLAFAIGSIFIDSKKKNARGQMIAAAVVNAVSAIIFTFVVLSGVPYETVTVMRVWRVFCATAFYYVTTVLYFVIAFVKTKQEDKTDEPIPYSD